MTTIPDESFSPPLFLGFVLQSIELALLKFQQFKIHKKPLFRLLELAQEVGIENK